MKNNKLLLALIACLIFSLPIHAAIRYVKPATAASTVWEDKIEVYTNLSTAIAAADSEDEIWLAGGTYEIGEGGINYNAAKNLKFYGSFSGTETSIDERAQTPNGKAWEFENPTILKMTHGSTAIWVNNSSIRALFDGLTIDGDNISGTRGIGGGAWSDLIVSQCIIKNNNTVGGFGAGILGRSKITVEYSLIDNNSASKPSSGSKWGGGICILAANSTIRYSTISNTTYDDSGAGIGIDNVGGVVVHDCDLIGNSTTNPGGGICGYQIAELYNCFIEGNSAGSGGGIYHRAYSGSSIIYNNIIVNNKANGATNGGGLALGNATNSVKVYNCIIANNVNGGVSYNNNTGNHQVINSVFYNNTNVGEVLNVKAAGSNNVFKNNILDSESIVNLNQVGCIVETNPAKLFADIDNGDYMPPTEGFVGVDKGNSAGLNFSTNTDIAGMARIQGDAIDVGAYEMTPSSFIALKSLKINGELIDGFMTGVTEYEVLLPSSATGYPTITAETALASASLSEFVYTPAEFNPETINIVSFTAINGSNSTEYTIQFTVDYMPELADLIISRIRADKLTRNKEALELNIDGFLPKAQADGSFSDCHYVSQQRGDGEVLIHLERLREMGIAYTQEGNKYFEDEALFTKIVRGFEFWYSKRWTDNNWYYNRIAHPQRLGEALMALHGGKKDIRAEKIFDDLVQRWRSEMGDPDSPNDATTAGANKSDIAMHWIYRSCLTLNEADLAKAADRSFLIIGMTTGEGLQHDWSFLQHGSQLYIGGYGTSFIQLVTRQASYLAGTKFALSGEKLEILSKFVRDTYLATIRGERMSYSVLGRGLTRANNTYQTGLIPNLEMLMSVDAEHATTYEAAIARIKGEAPASFDTPSVLNYFYRGEYTLQQRPAYYFDVRTASNRMMRSEYDINENRQGFFLTEGAMGIYVNGNEYGTVIPFWDWKKVPGTTTPYLDVMRRADSYLMAGRSSLAGGVSDGLYGVTAFESYNDQALFAWNDDDGYLGTPNNTGTRLPKLDFGSKKSWFIFDDEIVSLGAGIYSGHDENVFTTIDQCRQAGEAIVSMNGVESTIAKGEFTYDNVDWVLNDEVAYFFPNNSTVHLSNESKTGSWGDVNNSFGSDTQYTENLFTLWLDHGARPTNEKYAYIIVPNIKNSVEAKAYKPSNIEILMNTDSVQVVYHKELNVYGLAFFKAATFVSNDLVVDASDACVIMLKNVGDEEIILHAADPKKQASPISIGVLTPELNEMKLITYQNPAAPHQGQSLEFTVNNDSEKYKGKDVLLDRTNWTIRASSEGPVDATVAVDGDVPEYIIDGDDKSAFLFVKPGKSYGGVTVPADSEVWFEIDMKEANDMAYILYRHRDFNNSLAMLRVSKGSFYGKMNEDDAYAVILENFPIATDVTEVRIDLPELVTYRYVKFVLEEWDTASGSTMQVSEFNIGTNVLFETGTDIEENRINPISNFTIYPNPVKIGSPILLHNSGGVEVSSVEIYSVTGEKLYEQKLNSNKINNPLTIPGLYILYITQPDGMYPLKLIVE